TAPQGDDGHADRLAVRARAHGRRDRRWSARTAGRAASMIALLAVLPVLMGAAAQQQPAPQVNPPPNVQQTGNAQVPRSSEGALTLEQAIALAMRNNPDQRRVELVS